MQTLLPVMSWLNGPKVGPRSPSEGVTNLLQLTPVSPTKPVSPGNAVGSGAGRSALGFGDALRDALRPEPKVVEPKAEVAEPAARKGGAREGVEREATGRATRGAGEGEEREPRGRGARVARDADDVEPRRETKRADRAERLEPRDTVETHTQAESEAEATPGDDEVDATPVDEDGTGQRQEDVDGAPDEGTAEAAMEAVAEPMAVATDPATAAVTTTALTPGSQQVNAAAAGEPTEADGESDAEAQPATVSAPKPQAKATSEGDAGPDLPHVKLKLPDAADAKRPVGPPAPSLQERTQAAQQEAARAQPADANAQAAAQKPADSAAPVPAAPTASTPGSPSTPAPAASGVNALSAVPGAGSGSSPQGGAQNGQLGQGLAQPQAQGLPGDALDSPVERATMGRVLRGMQGALNQQGGSVTLRLTPAELGTLKIELAIAGGAVSARFSAETDTVRQLLSDRMAQLRTALERQGLSVERLAVQTQQPLPNTAQANTQQGHGGPGQQHAGGAPEDGRSRGQYLGQQQGGSESGRDGRGDGRRGGADDASPFERAMVNATA